MKWGESPIAYILKTSPVLAERPLAGAVAEADALLQLWNGRRGDRSMPAWQDFRVEEFSRWLGDLNLVEPVDSGRNFRFRVYGTRIAETVGYDMTGKFLTDLPVRGLVAASLALYGRVVETRAPYFVYHRAPTAERKKFWLRLTLPFAADGKAVDRILGYGQAIVAAKMSAVVESRFESGIDLFEALPAEPRTNLQRLDAAYRDLLQDVGEARRA